MEQKTKITYMAIIVLALAMGVASFSAAAKSDNAKEGNEKTVSEKNDDNGSRDKAKGIGKAEDNPSRIGKDDEGLFLRPNLAKGETNAQVHKEKTDQVKDNLKAVAKQEKMIGNIEVVNQVQAVVAEQEQAQIEATEAISKIENRNRVKTFLVGTDYKNLGQLRSNLAHNENEVRQLTKTLSMTQDADSQALIQEQIRTLMQERNRIKEVISANQGSFSLFGWLSRLMNGYEPAPVDDQSEEQLENDVQEAIDNAPETEEENADDTVTDTTETDTTATYTTGGTTDATDNSTTDDATTDNTTTTVQ